MFDFNSSAARKKPIEAVNIFHKQTNIGIGFKIMNINPNNPEWLAFLNECKAKKGICVLLSQCIGVVCSGLLAFAMPMCLCAEQRLLKIHLNETAKIVSELTIK